MLEFIFWLTGPIALIMCIIIFKRLKKIETHISTLATSPNETPLAKPQLTKYAPLPLVPSKAVTVNPNAQQQPAKASPPTITSQPKTNPFPEMLARPKVAAPTVSAAMPKAIAQPLKPLTPKTNQPDNTPDKVSIEQLIGTRWIPIAGIILLICGAAFFLKYAYDNFNISPLSRIIAVTVSGLVAIVVGEITRRRGYEIVAKSVTALGFALLYASVFVANAIYHIIDPWPALALAITITTVAMLYAVVLDEIVIAFLSLLGGYLSPIIISSQQNLPAPLFTYLFVLSIGAIQCAYYRKWRPVNFLTFIGTFALYTIWFMNYYGINVNYLISDPAEMPVAIIGLTAFFAVFLITPVLYELIKKTKAGKEDVLLILINSAITFYYLYAILNPTHRLVLGFATLAMSAIHLALMAIFVIRSKEDSDLHAVLLAIGILFFTVSLSLFFKAGVLSFAWALQGVVLALIGTQYRSLMIRVFGLVALALSCLNLLLWFPIHSAEFNFIFNPSVGVWLSVAAAAYVNHLVYRHASQEEGDLYSVISQILYVLMGILLISVSVMEWVCHCDYNLHKASEYMVLKAIPVILAAALALFFARPLCPSGKIRECFAAVLTAAGIVFTLISLAWLHNKPFTVIANMQFLSVALFPATLAVYHILHRFVYTDASKIERNLAQHLYGIAGIITMLIASTEWYFRCNLNQADMFPSVLIGQTIIFAVSLPFFIVRPLSPMGITSRSISVVLAVLALLYTVIATIFFYDNAFRIFLNFPFFVGLVFTASLAASSIFLFRKDSSGKNYPKLGIFFGLSFIVVLWALLTEQIFLYWYCLNEYEVMTVNWIYQAYMYISIMWALYAAVLMVVGFWRRLPILRYVALGLFGLLLAKIFIIDTSQVENIYRIAAFLATGGVLVAVSYLYQFLKKKNFFENLAPTAIMNEEE